MGRLINTEEFIKRIDHYPPDIRNIAKKELRYCKTVDAAPVVHGHWIVIDNKDNKEGYMKMQCSVCGETLWSNEGEEWYCCKCGAKMDEVTE